MELWTLPLRVLLVFALVGYAHCDRGFTESTTAARKFIQNASPNGLLRSIPAMAKRRMQNSLTRVTEVASAVKTRRKMPGMEIFDGFSGDQVLKKILDGSTPQTIRGLSSSSPSSTRIKQPTPLRSDLRGTMSETLSEMRSMREEMEALRRELKAMKRQMGGFDDDEAEPGEEGPAARRKRLAKQREFDKIAKQVEDWAEELLFKQGGEEDGWSEVKCSKVFRASMNKDGQTRAYVRWMKDSREEHAQPDDNREYPCIKMYSTIDAPMQNVCAYLSQEKHFTDYNDLVLKHRELEEIAPHAKICWGQTPQILFVKPRDFLTFCYLKWRNDGTQVVLNQACDYDGMKATAYAIRGATYIGKDPDDPEKTRVSMLAHGSPGQDVPTWAAKTAVSALSPIEPFRLFHKIQEAVKRDRVELEQCLQEVELVGAAGRNTRPGGLAQLGYACFWPKGGGLNESRLPPLRQVTQKEEVEEGEGDQASQLESPEATENESVPAPEVLGHANSGDMDRPVGAAGPDPNQDDGLSGGGVSDNTVSAPIQQVGEEMKVEARND